VSDAPEDPGAAPPERVPEHIAVYQRIRRVFGDPSRGPRDTYG
jgi:hypothetical protein